MTSRSWPTWMIFALCVLMVLAAMAWISRAVLRAGRAELIARHDERRASRRAAEEEHARLALWRMDSVMAPFVAQESARPAYVYRPYLPVARPVDRMLNPNLPDDVKIPSPLLADKPMRILVHFQFEPDGKISSPQIPAGENTKLPRPEGVTNLSVQEAAQYIAAVKASVDRDRLLAMLPEQPGSPAPSPATTSPLAQDAGQRAALQTQRRLDLDALGRGAVEFNQRSQLFQQNVAAMVGTGEANQPSISSLTPSDVAGAVMTPLWIGEQLILARRVNLGGRQYVQGCLLDWPGIKQSLLESIEDLLPHADLEPLAGNAATDQSHLLAALPIRLVPDRSDSMSSPDNGPDMPAGLVWSPTTISLVVAWCCMFVATVAVGLLLSGVMRLSQRRAAFASAVTHELRTPLTTFQMYSEMLAEGMVTDPEQRQQYLATLRSESARLCHLVENVLAYSRLERGRACSQLETIATAKLIEGMQPHLATRAEQADMELVVEPFGDVADAPVAVNVAAVEQILLNLVDNACKYAAGTQLPQIHLSLRKGSSGVEVRVRDHGPGIPASVSRRLFQPFTKSAHDAAGTAPGVGLGLALSRQLARHMGGQLGLDKSISDGTCFVLTLPRQPADARGPDGLDKHH